jgi:prepilin-type N-terminal cleavage/methylation domain-containing protein
MRLIVPKFGFTMVELVVVILVIAIISSIALVRMTGTSDTAKINATITHAQMINNIAEMRKAELGRWPNDVNSGVFPSDFGNRVRRDAFVNETPLGGQWDWNGPGTSLPYFGISIKFSIGDPVPTALIQQLDQIYDDNDLTTGKIIVALRNGSTFVYFILEPAS